MKIKFLILVLISCSLLTCKNKNEKQLDWKQVVEQQIETFENDKILVREGDLKVGMQIIKYSIFNSENSKLTKYEMNSSLGTSFPLKEEIYLKNSKIIFSKWSGLSPYLNKGKESGNSKFCAAFEEKTYFKSAKKAVRLKKKIDLMKSNDYEAALEKLNKIQFEDTLLEQAYPEYDRLLRTIEMVGV